MQSEILTLECRHLDLEAGTLRQDLGTTKNGEGRVVCLPANLAAVLRAQQVARVKARLAGQPRRDFATCGLRLARRPAWRVGFAMIFAAPRLGT